MTETKIFISKATKRNWDKLKNSGDDRLTRRANKSCSQKTIAVLICGIAVLIISSFLPQLIG